MDNLGGKVSSNGRYFTDSNGDILITDITGTLVITEEKTLDGYTIDEGSRTQTVTVNPDDGQTLYFYNAPIGGVEILKVNEAKRTERIPNTTFEIRRADDALVKTVTTDRNTPVSAQVQITKYAAEDNPVTGQKKGTVLQSAVYEVVRERSNTVVGQVVTDARGIAAITLPLGRYLIREVSAPGYWQLSGETFDVTLEYAGQIIKLADYDKPAELGVTITKTGVKEVLAGNKMTYYFKVANESNVSLEEFYWHDTLPYDITTATVLTTGTYSQRLNYRVLYKTNYTGYRTLASNLLTTNNYSFQLNGLQLQEGEAVTDVYFDFGTVPAGFQSLTQPSLVVAVSPTLLKSLDLVLRKQHFDKFVEISIAIFTKPVYNKGERFSEGGRRMPTITPISDLRNYGTVLEKVEVGSPVYLTRNGHGVYSIRDMQDEENFQKAEAMIQLLCELNAGIRSGEEQGWLSEENVMAHFRDRREGAE